MLFCVSVATCLQDQVASCRQAGKLYDIQLVNESNIAVGQQIIIETEQN